MIQGIHHIALFARDLERVARFYESVLGLARETEHHHDDGRLRSIWLRAGDTRIMVEEAEADGPSRPVGWQVVAFSIAAKDRQAAAARLSEAGHAVTHETEFTIYALDPEGNRVALSHY